VATLPASHPAAPKATSLECAEFNKTGNPCKRGKGCRDDRCRNPSKATATSPKSAVKGGDGGNSAQLAAMEARLKGHIDSRFKAAEGIVSAQVKSLTNQVATGFTETKTLLTAQQQATLGMQKAMEALMLSTATFQSSVSGLLTAGGAPRRELTASSARLAICASGGGSSVTEMPESRRSESGITGTHIDLISSFLAEKGLSVDGTLQTAVLSILGTTPLIDHTRAILSSIASSTKDDNLAALLFMLLTGSQQFRRSDLESFRKSCETQLGASRASTQAIFSTVCQAMISKNLKWEIKKKTGVIVANSLLKDSSQHPAAFDALVRNFQS